MAIVSVTDFGALGDGETDDAAAIQAAIDAADAGRHGVRPRRGLPARRLLDIGAASAHDDLTAPGRGCRRRSSA